MLRLLALVVACFVVPVSADQPPRVRVLSYNIHHGEGTDGKLDLGRIAKIIKDAKPDLVALQEVDYTNDRTGRVDQATELAKLTGLTAVPGDNIDYRGGRYGNAALIRGKVLSHKNHPLPSLYPGEQRGVLATTVELGEGAPPVRFLCTHLDHRPKDAERLASVKFIRELMTQDDGLALLAGDLNALPDSEVLKQFGTHWENPLSTEPLPTFPAAEPIRQIDYVLARPKGQWRTVEATVLDEPIASDHRPLLVVLEWSGQDQ